MARNTAVVQPSCAATSTLVNQGRCLSRELPSHAAPMPGQTKLQLGQELRPAACHATFNNQVKTRPVGPHPPPGSKARRQVIPT